MSRPSSAADELYAAFEKAYEASSEIIERRAISDAYDTVIRPKVEALVAERNRLLTFWHAATLRANYILGLCRGESEMKAEAKAIIAASETVGPL